MRWLYRMGVLALVLTCSVPSTQAQTSCTPQKSIVNRLGVSRADLTVGATATKVIDVNQTRCHVFLRNIGANPMRCLPINQGFPTASTGWLFASGDQVLMESEGREEWYCIRVTSDTTVTTVEGMP